MALAYAFIDEDGTRYGEENPAGGFTEFPYVPASGPFAGRRLMVHATSWDGFPSNTRLHASERWGCQATIEVEELLDGPRDLLTGPSSLLHESWVAAFAHAAVRTPICSVMSLRKRTTMALSSGARRAAAWKRFA